MLSKKLVKLILEFDQASAPVQEVVIELKAAYDRYEKASAQKQLWDEEIKEAEKEVQKIQKKADSFLNKKEDKAVKLEKEELPDVQ